MEIDTPSGITKKFGKHLWEAKAKNMYHLMTDLRSNESISTCYPFGQYHHITLKENTGIEMLKKSLEEGEHLDLTIQQIEPTIEDRFMELMKQ